MSGDRIQGRFGGQKPSGDGADRGLRGLAEFTALKTTYSEIEGAS